MLIIAQQLLASRVGLASGLVLGLGFSMGALGTPITGLIGDAIGLRDALGLMAVITLATIALAWLLPSEARLKSIRSDPGTSAPAAAM